MHAPSMYFLGPESTLNAVHRADILSSIFSPFMFWVVPTASSKVAVPRPATSRLCTGRKMKWSRRASFPFSLLFGLRQVLGQKPRGQRREATFREVSVGLYLFANVAVVWVLVLCWLLWSMTVHSSLPSFARARLPVRRDYPPPVQLERVGRKANFVTCKKLGSRTARSLALAREHTR